MCKHATFAFQLPELKSVDNYSAYKRLAADRHLNKTIRLIEMPIYNSRGKDLFAVGHIALGYICGIATSKTLKTSVNLPLILLLSIIPDIDILIQQLEHRGPTHSIIVATILFIPFLVIYKKKAIPYFAALIQHFLIGDFISGGNIQLFWPINTQFYGIKVGIENPVNIALEWILFTASIFTLFKTNQIITLFRHHNSNFLLLIPTSTVLLPIFLGFPLTVPVSMIPPHLICSSIFSASIIVNLTELSKRF
jgi:membrane-bound metal-dependent hydrolase YbcI (DUF457 family)